MKLHGIVLVIALVLAALTPLAASAEGVTYTPKTQVMNLNIGCQQAADGTTCSTTQYWLGRGNGTNNVGSSLDFTPLGYSQGGTVQDFAGDSTLNSSYVLRTDKNLKAVVQMTGFLGPVVAGDATIGITVTGHKVGTAAFQRVTIASGTLNKPADTNGTFAFDLPIAANLEKVEVDSLTVTVTKGSINLLTWGFMNGQGGSNITLPYYTVTAS